jgi:hypothetical protein
VTAFHEASLEFSWSEADHDPTSFLDDSTTESFASSSETDSVEQSVSSFTQDSDSSSTEGSDSSFTEMSVSSFDERSGSRFTEGSGFLTGDESTSSASTQILPDSSDSLNLVARTPSRSLTVNVSGPTRSATKSRLRFETEQPGPKAKVYMGYVMAIVVTSLVGSVFFVYSVHMEIVLAKRRLRNTVVGVVKDERRRRRRKRRLEPFYSV